MSYFTLVNQYFTTIPFKYSYIMFIVSCVVCVREKRDVERETERRPRGTGRVSEERERERRPRGTGRERERERPRGTWRDSEEREIEERER